MRSSLRAFIAVAMVAMAAIVVPWLVWPWVQQSVFGSCEGFGCAGGLAFALPVSLAGGSVAALAAVLAFAWTSRQRDGAGRRAAPPLLRVLVMSLLLAPLLRSVPKWPLPDYALPFAWLAVCVLAYWLALRLFRRSS